MKAVILHNQSFGAKEMEIDVPLAQVEHPEKCEPESLYPVSIKLHGLCPSCPETHILTCERIGFRLHDDGQIAVYQLKTIE